MDSGFGAGLPRARLARRAGLSGHATHGTWQEVLEFKPAEHHVYRRFLYLDGDEVLNSLSAIQGGDVEEVLDQAVREGGGGAGFAIGAGPAMLELKGHRKRTVKQELTRKRTAHSAVETFLTQLHQSGGLSRLSGGCDPGVYERLTENDTLQIDVDLQRFELWMGDYEAPPRLRRVRRFFSRQPYVPSGLGLSEGIASVGRNKPLQDDELNFDLTVLIPVKRRWMLDSAHEFRRQATVVGQIMWILNPGEVCEWNKFSLELQHDSGDWETNSYLKVEPRRSVDGNLQWRGPTIAVNPLCVYK